jgi:hypothetical protein
VVPEPFGVEITPPPLAEPYHKATVTIETEPGTTVTFRVLINERSWVRIKSHGYPLELFGALPVLSGGFDGGEVDVHLSGIVSHDEIRPITIELSQPEAGG